MTDQTWKLLSVIGAAVFAVGLYLGFGAAVKVPAINTAQNCGTAFEPTDYQGRAGAVIAAECDSKRSDRRTWAYVAMILGGVVGGYAVSQSSWRSPLGARTRVDRFAEKDTETDV